MTDHKWKWIQISPNTIPNRKTSIITKVGRFQVLQNRPFQGKVGCFKFPRGCSKNWPKSKSWNFFEPFNSPNSGNFFPRSPDLGVGSQQKLKRGGWFTWRAVGRCNEVPGQVSIVSPSPALLGSVVRARAAGPRCAAPKFVGCSWISFRKTPQILPTLAQGSKIHFGCNFFFKSQQRISNAKIWLADLRSLRRERVVSKLIHLNAANRACMETF